MTTTPKSSLPANSGAAAADIYSSIPMQHRNMAIEVALSECLRGLDEGRPIAPAAVEIVRGWYAEHAKEFRDDRR